MGTGILSTDQIERKVLQQYCDTLAEVFTADDQEKITDAEKHIIAMAMIMCGYSYKSQKRGYIRVEGAAI